MTNINYPSTSRPTKNVWFSSDLHLNHANIIRYSNRPFANINEMNETLIANWNRCVAKGDDVYFLGDFCMGNKEIAQMFRRRLNGTVYFIEGNHDSAAFQIRNTFGWFHQLQKIVLNKQEIVLCHYSMEVWNKSHHGAWHLYGHSHNSLPERKTHRSFDVGVDAVAMRLVGKRQAEPICGTKPEDYRPMSFDEIAKVMNAKDWKPIDHHGEERQ